MKRFTLGLVALGLVVVSGLVASAPAQAQAFRWNTMERVNYQNYNPYTARQIRRERIERRIARERAMRANWGRRCF